MSFDIHVYFHNDGENKILAALAALTERIDAMSAQLDALTAAVTAENTVIDSAITLLNGLSAQIIELKDDPAALQALADSVTAEAAKLADAITANTPVEPGPGPT